MSVSNLTVGYGREPVAENLSFELSGGEILAVIGHNGSGKSTLVKTLLGVEAPLAGDMRWSSGQAPSPIGYLGQLTEFDRRFPMRASDLIATGAWADMGFFGGATSETRERTAAAIRAVGLEDMANIPLHKLSSGQLQRALFARTFVQDAQVIILDEPFAAVDQNTEAELMDHVLAWVEQGRAVIMVLHNLSTVLQHCQRTLLLGKGRGVFGETAEVLNTDALVELGYLAADQANWMASALKSRDTGHV